MDQKTPDNEVVYHSFNNQNTMQNQNNSNQPKDTHMGQNNKN